MVIVPLLLLSSVMNVGEISPLGENAIIRLDSTVDGGDSLGEGFAALVENVRQWRLPLEEHALAQLQQIGETPTAYRGDIFEIAGFVEQQSPLAFPWEGIEEWFVRTNQGKLCILYVVDGMSNSAKGEIRSPARFYTTMSLEGRDQQVRLYPAFVTSTIAIQYAIPTSKFPLPLILFPIVAFAALFVWYLGKVGAKKRTKFVITGVHAEEVLDAAIDSGGELPFDPASALAAMHKQAKEHT